LEREMALEVARFMEAVAWHLPSGWASARKMMRMKHIHIALSCIQKRKWSITSQHIIILSTSHT
jgi:hypothetical protein